MPASEINAAAETLRSNEHVLAASEIEVGERHAERIRLVRELHSTGMTQQRITDIINDIRLEHEAAPITVHAVQKGLARTR